MIPSQKDFAANSGKWFISNDGRGLFRYALWRPNGTLSSIFMTLFMAKRAMKREQAGVQHSQVVFVDEEGL